MRARTRTDANGRRGSPSPAPIKMVAALGGIWGESTKNGGDAAWEGGIWTQHGRNLDATWAESGCSMGGWNLDTTWAESGCSMGEWDLDATWAEFGGSMARWNLDATWAESGCSMGEWDLDATWAESGLVEKVIHRQKALRIRTKKFSHQKSPSDTKTSSIHSHTQG